MIQIASQPLVRNYTAHPLSRSFFISYLCYILVIVIPATILVNINYSWPDYKRLLITPSLTYQAYQISCINSVNQIIYNTNFQAAAQPKNYVANVNVGIQGRYIKIIGQVFASNIRACSSQIYFSSKLSNSVEVISHLPLNFGVNNDNLNLKQIDIRGTASFKSSKPISQSSIVSVNQSTFGSYPYSFSGNFLNSGTKSVTLDSRVLYQKNQLSPTTTNSFTFSANFRILTESYMQQTSLIDKMRAFIPIFMYISLFMWWVIIEPLIQWMLKNKVYNARANTQKIKKQ